MSLVHRHCRAVASAALVAVALGTAPGASHAQYTTMGAEAQRRSVELQRLRAEQRRGVERAAAHAQMPSTMYASTPDPSPPPHAVPLDVKRPSLPAPTGAEVAVLGSAAGSGHRIALFVSAAGASGYEGYARVVNRSALSGEVRIEGYDDAGTLHGPVSLRLGAGEAVHFSATELEQGNAELGLTGRLGTGEGAWRLELASALDLEVLSYVRTADGFLTAMHDGVAPGEGGYRVVWFSAGGDAAQASRLRLVNPGAEAAAVRIEGIDDAGASSAGAVVLTLGGGAARTLGAAELESGEGEGLVGALGTGTGRWRLVVSADPAIEVMSLVASASGHLSNVSTVPGPVGSAEGGVGAVHRVPYLPAASRWVQGSYRGLVRIVNRSGEAGEVRIEAIDDAGVQAPAVTVSVGAGEAVELSSSDLERGSTAKGLSGGVGTGEGDWWLRLGTSLDIDVLAYVQSEDGFVGAMHDGVPRVGGVHRVGVFNPASETSQASRLRLVNPGVQPAAVRIEGIDDAGASSGGAVTLTLAGGEARTLGAEALESGAGAGVSGALGDGEGRWRLAVRADTAIEVMSLLADPSGHVANLSTAPGAATSQSAAEVFARHVSGPVVQAKCVACHVVGGIAGAGISRLQFEREANSEHQALNLQAFEDILAAVDDGAIYILNKIQGVAHGGGAPVAAGTVEFTAMERFLALLGEEEVTAVALTPQTLFETVTMAPTRKTLRRAALIFAGRNPTDEEYAAAQGGAAALRATIRGFMTGPEFHEFLIRGANDRLLTERDFLIIGADLGGYYAFVNETYRRKKAAHDAGGTARAFRRQVVEWNDAVQHGFRRAPLALIAHVVENDLPYTEILTADYIMANPWAARAYGATTDHFADPQDMHEFKPSSIESYYRPGEGYEREYDHVVGAERIISPGPLITAYPHAGILNTASFLSRYPTTATNRNRARSRWTYYHFLGLDIEKSASRTTDPVALADTNNPTLLNPACTVCHTIMDPVAGTYQNYADMGHYKYSWGGVDSLDDLYKVAGEPPLAIEAEAWEDRQTLSWPVSLGAGVQTLRVLYTNDFYDPETGDDGVVYLDRLRISDVRRGVTVTHEFEDLGAPVPPPGSGFSCGGIWRSPDGRKDAVQLPNGGIDCAVLVDIEVPNDGAYDVEVVAWMNGRHELYGDDGYAKLSIAVNPYQAGDTWYRDMRTPGFGAEVAPNSDNSVQWLAKQVAADPRFAEATVRFWWPAVMGSEVARPPEDDGVADFEGLLLAANAQGAEVTRLANGFRSGFHGRPVYSLKDLLVEIVLSKWFRANSVRDVDPVRQVALGDAGAGRLLTPEELERKTAAVTGFRWGRKPRISQAHLGDRTRLTDDFRLLYGGIDSDGITERARDVTTVMAGVAKRHATEVSCPVVMRDFFLVPDAERRLFAGFDRSVTPGFEFGASFEIEAGSAADKETLSISGALAAGAKTVQLEFTNDYWGGDDTNDRNVHLDRLVVRNSAGEIVATVELEELPSPGNCCIENGDNFALWGQGTLTVPIEIPAEGSHSIEVVAWADQAGDELARLQVVVEDAGGSGAGADAIRSKLVELYDKLLGVQVTPHSPDIESAYQVFVNAMERRREANDTWFEWQCDTHFDLTFFEGIVGDVVVENENEVDGWRSYEIDWDRLNAFMDTVDFSDPGGTAQAWVVVLAYLLMDYRYLYL